MDFICHRADITFGVKTASRALGMGSTLPILAGIKLEVENQQLRLMATDLVRAIVVTVPIENHGTPGGTCVLNGGLFSKITGMLPDEKLSLRLDDSGDRVTITSGEATFELLLMPVEDYPQIPSVQREICAIRRERLMHALSLTTFAAMSAKETSRLNLTGVDILMSGRTIKMVATNGYRLALKEEQLESSVPEGEFLIDADALRDLQGILGTLDDEQVRIAQGEGHLFFLTHQVLFIARLIQEEYPDFERVIPKDNPVSLHIKREAFLSALQRAQITTAEESGAVILESRDASLWIKSSSAEKGHTEERVPLLKPAPAITISFRGEYLIDALRRMKGAEVVLWLKDAESAGLLEPLEGEEDQGFLYVCMPIRMD